MEQKPDAYSPDNLLRYHMALSFVDQLEAEGFLASGDKAAMYALIAEKFWLGSLNRRTSVPKKWKPIWAS